MKYPQIGDLVGKTFSDVKRNGGVLSFIADDKTGFEFYHDQDCCESVTIEDICGDLSDLVGSPIVLAEEVGSDDAPVPESAESYTWTFYKFATAKGAVTVRWLGESNGYYSERVDLHRIEDK